ncbi:FkbM family methyltransferase [Methylobacterium komagatae]
MDDLLTRQGLSERLPRSLIWIDVQGWELQVLLGARAAVAAGVPIVIEFWPYGLQRNGMMDGLAAFLCEHFTQLTVANSPEMPAFPATGEGIAAIRARLDGTNPSSACDLLLRRDA